MDLLVFDAKRNKNPSETPVCFHKEDLHEMLGNQKIVAYFNGGLVQIFDEQASRILFENAGIGQWLDDDRNESREVSSTCFCQEDGDEASHKMAEKAAENWSEQSPVYNILVLSSMETVLLSIDWQILNVKNMQKVLTDNEIWLKMKDYDDKPEDFGKCFAVFRFLKLNGWIVSSGLTFGCHFLIYCHGAQFYHSSAGVLITNEIDPQRLLTLTRILSHNKKALIVANTSEDVQSFEDVRKVEVKIVTMKTYFLERDVALMSNKQNEIYELTNHT